MAKKSLICAECKSDAITLDASAYWCEDTQQYVLQNTFDEAYCETCEKSVETRWTDLPD